MIGGDSPPITLGDACGGGARNIRGEFPLITPADSLPITPENAHGEGARMIGGDSPLITPADSQPITLKTLVEEVQG